MNAFLKNIPLLLLAAFGTASCGFLSGGHIPVPPTPADKPWRGGGYEEFASVYAQYCLGGDYTGEKITSENTTRTHGEFWVNRWKDNLGKMCRPNPDGRGKICGVFNLYTYKKTPPPPQFGSVIPGGVEKWGFSFTFYTTDDDIITDCKVTKRLLRRW
jgi:hypothetical protein